jgi:hypothetical protein
MHEVEQNIDALLDDIVRRLALDVRDETNAAGVVLIAGIVKSLARRKGHGSLCG